MSTKIVFLSCFLMLCAVSAQARLVAYYPLDGDASDMSGNAPANGTLVGNTTFEAGKFGQAIKLVNSSTQYVNCGQAAKFNITANITMMAWVKVTSWNGGMYTFLLGRGDDSWRLGRATNADGAAMAVNDTAAHTAASINGPTNINDGNWHHVAGTFNSTTLILYVDGKQDGTATYSGAICASTQPFCIGANTTYPTALRCWDGWVDEVMIFDEVLPPDKITELMNSGLSLSQGAASSPSPVNGEPDVAKDVTLSWKSGQYIAEGGTHNVFFGTDFNDVNDATITNTLGVTISQGLAKDVNYLDPGTLEYGTTYYWRVDEVNAPASIGQYKGQTWSFTVEPVALKLTKENIIKVTVKNSAANNDPNNTINEAGLDPNTDLHSTGGCWVSGSANAADPAWIRYDFDRLYKIHEMFVWNYNVVASSKYGFKSVRIEYSTNGSSWTDLNTVTEFASGTSKVGYACNTTVPFNDIVASSVRITALSIQSGTYTKAGLAEVRFTIIPTYARIPSPGTGETDFSIDRILSWRPGREADKHDVYISTDSAAVLNHAVPAHTVTVNGYSPLLDFGRTYYWSVTEVSNTMTPSRWAGDIWDFTTAEYGSLDDFEDYNGVPGREIYSFWLDGYESITNGSIIGLNNSPYVETTIVQHGKQSAPISYDNTGTLEPAATYSEVTRTFDTALNLKVNGADSLRLYYRGQAITFGELSGCIAMSGEGADIGGTSDQFRYAYKTLTGNGSITARVDSVENRNAATEAGIMIRNTIDANSAFAMANLIPNGTPSFQRRLTAGASAASTNLTAIGNPYWVKITRNGSTFTAQRSADGTNWISFETDANKPTTATITMGNNVLIGFAVSSHVADVIAAATFSGVATSGNISTGAWTVAPIGDATQADGLNTIDALYVVAEDNAGNKSKVFAPGDAVGSVVWMQLTVPYTQFTGVDMSKLKKLTIGVGDLAATAKGKGTIYIDNISYGHTIVK